MLFAEILEMADRGFAVDLERQNIGGTVFAGYSAFQNDRIVAIIAERCGSVFIRHNGRAAAVAGID